MIVKREEEISSRTQPVVRWFKKLMPVTPEVPRGQILRARGMGFAPPRLWSWSCCWFEFSDLIFAVDSIPAIFAVTKDPFIVYTSNVFAILGLRSLYFALAGVMDKSHYLKIGLGVVLSFVGVKMILTHTAWKIDTLVSLGRDCGDSDYEQRVVAVASQEADTFKGPMGADAVRDADVPAKSLRET